MDRKAIIQSQACQRLLAKLSRLLEEKFANSLELLLSHSRIEEETELYELGVGNCLLLVLLRGLAEGDIFLCTALLELTDNFPPLKSKHLSAWLQEDFDIGRDVAQKAVKRAKWLNQTKVLHVPDSVLKILTALAERPRLIDAECQVELGGGTTKACEPQTAVEEIPCRIRYYEAEDKPPPAVEKLAYQMNHYENKASACPEDSELGDLAQQSKEDSLSAAIEVPFKKVEVDYDTQNFYEVILQFIEKESNLDLDAKDSNGETALHRAAVSGKEAIVTWLLDRGQDIDIKDSLWRTPLCHAAKAGQLSIVQLLVDRGANVNCRDSARMTPLHFAACAGHLHTVHFLVERMAEVNCKANGGWTPLHITAQEGHLTTVELLLGKGADVNCRDSSRWTPLHSAAHAGHLSMVELLVARGAEVNSLSSAGRTPLYYATHSNRTAVAGFLQLKGGIK